jgi:hypothetical protein
MNSGNFTASSFIVAKNWDRLGGRLTEILNGLYLAKRFDLQFRFVWPMDTRWPEVQQLLAIFSPQFLERHLVTPESLEGIPEVLINLDGTMSEESFSQLLESDPQGKAIRLTNFMEIPEFKGDSKHFNLREYEVVSESIWSKDLSLFAKMVDLEYRQKTVLHARFGDLVTGQWNNWIDPRKYITALQIDEAIEKNKRLGIKTCLISDSQEVFQIFPRSKAPNVSALQNEWGFDVESLNTIEDLFRMKSSRELIAPEASAFSSLGARLGGKEVKKLTRSKINIWQAIENLEATKVLWSQGVPEEVAAFLSRDIDQQINSLSGVYDVGLFGEISGAALLADPNNVQSLNNRVIFHALNGDFDECQNLLEKAMGISLGAIEIHHDPLFITLTTESLVHIISQFSGPSEINTNQLGIHLTEIQQRLSSLEPYQLDKNWVLRSLSDIIDFLNKHFGNDRVLTDLSRDGVLTKIQHNRFVGQSKNVFVLNLLDSIVKLLLTETWVQERDALVQERDALVQERDAIINTRTWRWLKPFRRWVARLIPLH